MIYDDVSSPESLSSVIKSLFLTDKDMQMLSFVQFLFSGLRVTGPDHKWTDDEARPVSIALTASADATDWDTTDDITALPVPSATVDQLRVGDMLILAGGNEAVIVKAVDYVNNTIDLVARGHGSTTATVQGEVEFTALIVGNAQVEDADVLASNYVSPTDVVNYTQIFEDSIQVTGTQKRSKELRGDSGAGSEKSRQIAKKMKELLRSLNYTLAEGIKGKDTTNKIRAMGGLREFMSTVYNVGGALTKAKMYTVAETIINAGGTPTQIHGSVETISAIEQLYESTVTLRPSDVGVGLEVTTIKMMGLILEVHVDRDMRAGEFFMLDNQRISYGPLAGGEEDGTFKIYDGGKKNGKQDLTQILGEYTMEVRNAAGAGVRAYGIT